MQVRTLEPHEASLHRQLRLRALRDSPGSFGETLEDTESRPLSYWEGLTKTVTVRGPYAMFLACEGESVLGSTYGLLDREKAGWGRVGGTWVAPAWRRRGVGGALLVAVLAWARERKLEHLGLWAPAHEPGAIALYEQAGFHETGYRRPLPTDAGLEIVEMVCKL